MVINRVSVIRWLLTVILLGYVWKNAHWSVFTCLLLLTVEAEIDIYFLGKIVKATGVLEKK